MTKVQDEFVFVSKLGPHGGENSSKIILRKQEDSEKIPGKAIPWVLNFPDGTAVALQDLVNKARLKKQKVKVYFIEAGKDPRPEGTPLERLTPIEKIHSELRDTQNLLDGLSDTWRKNNIQALSGEGANANEKALLIQNFKIEEGLVLDLGDYAHWKSDKSFGNNLSKTMAGQNSHAAGVRTESVNFSSKEKIVVASAIIDPLVVAKIAK